MLKAWSVTSFMWVLLCLLAGALLGAMMARVLAPASTPDLPWSAGLGVQFSMALGGAVAAVVVAAGGFGWMWLDERLAQMSANAVLKTLARVLVGSAAGAIVGALLAFLIVGPSYQELRVAMLDYQGAPLIMGALAGGVTGALRGVAASKGVGIGIKIILAVSALVAGAVLGLVLGAVIAFSFIQLMTAVGA